MGMRSILIAAFALLATLVSTSALAEPNRAWSQNHEPAFSLALLDGFRAGPVTVQSIAVGKRGPQKNARAEEPGEAVTAYVAEVWSQVRAYKRTGGAELIVRGRF
jgi:hypothetical protein